MSRTISMTFPHDLTVPEVKKRVTERFDLLKSEYIDKIGHAELAWVGDVAHLQARALGQSASASITVEPITVKVEIELPWLLAAMASKIEGVLQKNAQDTLRIGTTKKV